MRYFLKHIFGVACFSYGSSRGSTKQNMCFKLKDNVLFRSRGDEVLVPGPDQDVLLCCSGCSKLTLICPISLASYKWLKFRHIDWYEKAWGGQVVQQMRAKDRTFETVRNLYGFCHIWWHVYSTFCIWGVPCPAVVCCCDDWEIDFNVIMYVIFVWLFANLKLVDWGIPELQSHE